MYICLYTPVLYCNMIFISIKTTSRSFLFYFERYRLIIFLLPGVYPCFCSTKFTHKIAILQIQKQEIKKNERKKNKNEERNVIIIE